MDKATVVAGIVAWAEERNLINGSTPIKQSMKLFSEWGEGADNSGKGIEDKLKDDIGDQIVVLTVISKMLGQDITPYIVDIPVGDWAENTAPEKSREEIVFDIMEHMHPFAKKAALKGEFDAVSLSKCLIEINNQANTIGVPVIDCMKHSLGEISLRKGIMCNGIYIKDTAPEYAAAVEIVRKQNEAKAEA